jgi:hypothetical protein
MEAAMSLHVRTIRCLAAGLTGLALAAPAARAEAGVGAGALGGLIVLATGLGLTRRRGSSITSC